MNSPAQPRDLKRQWFRSAVRFFGRLALLALLVTAVLIALWSYALRHADREIRDFFEQELASYYRDFEVSVGSARLVQDRGIEIHNISIRQPTRDASTVEVAHIGEVFITCNATLQDLVTGSLDVSHVSIRRPKIVATRQGDGSYNAARLFPLPKFGEFPPPASIEDGVVQWIDPASGSHASVALRDLNLTIEHVTADSASYYDPQRAANAAETRTVRVHGSLAADHFRRAEVDFSFGPGTGRWSATGTIVQLQIGPQLIAALPLQWADVVEVAAGLQGEMNLSFQVSNPPEGQSMPLFVATGELTEGQITDPRLPAPLTDVRAFVSCDNNELRIDKLSARGGLGQLELTCNRQGLSADSPMVLSAKARRFILDSRLADVLPADLLETWDKFLPVGLVDAELNLSFDGREWKPDLLVKCLDVSFSYYKFPYRVGSGVGTVHLKDDNVAVQLRVLAAGQIVRIEGDIQHPGPDSTGLIEFALEGPIPLDEKLLSALDAKSQRVVRSLRPRGMITVVARFERKDQQQAEVDRYVNITLRDCAINYDEFPYPLTRIRGTLESNNGQWKFRDLEGYNDSGYVVCQGGWTTGDGGGQLNLDFVATDVPLEDELRDALPEAAQRMWSELRPRGSIDHLKIALQFDNSTNQTSLDVRAQKWKQKQNVEGRGISVHPQWFPYQLDNVTGAVHFHNGRVELTNIAAVHGRTGITLSGRCEFLPDRRWWVHLERLAADRLQLDHDLIVALPEQLGKAVNKLHLTGPLCMQGSFNVTGNSAAAPTESNWDLSFDVENGGFDCGIRLEHIHGGVRLVGARSATSNGSRGEITVDSLLYRDVQLTQIAGPFWIDDNEVIFGSWAGQPEQQGPPRQVTAKVFGGTLSFDARVSSSGRPEFLLQTTLSEADLVQFAQELAPQLSHKISGKANVVLELRGVGGQPHTLRGGGLVRLHDADIYEVPVMLALLKVLSIRRPDKTAFTTSNIDFDVQGDNIYFKRIDFNGDAISLKGQGEMNLDRQINVHFYTMVGSDRIRIPIVTPLIGAASRQLLLIRASGSLDHPDLKREPLPVLNDTLKQLFPEAVEGEPNTNRSLPTPREVLQRSGLLPRR